jgi:GrpB-like predicted nucleotidyltransferase (UPF0157 family)
MAEALQAPRTEQSPILVTTSSQRKALQTRLLRGLAPQPPGKVPPSLAAKPIIDIALVVADSGDEPAYVPALEAVGYRLRLRTPDWDEHRMFKGPDADVNLHVFSPGSNEVTRLVCFRDHLRADAADRERYAAEKRHLAGRH